MYAILVSALGAAIRWATSAAAFKAITATLIMGGLSVLLSLLVSLIPGWLSADSITGYANAFPPAMWYFIDYFKLEDGIALTLGAYGTRFLIRRIPFFG